MTSSPMHPMTWGACPGRSPWALPTNVPALCSTSPGHPSLSLLASARVHSKWWRAAARQALPHSWARCCPSHTSPVAGSQLSQPGVHLDPGRRGRPPESLKYTKPPQGKLSLSELCPYAGTSHQCRRPLSALPYTQTCTSVS